MTTTSRYWHASCKGIDVDFTTTGEHKPESADIHKFPFQCPLCGQEHVALEVTQAERDILKGQDTGCDLIPPEAVERIEGSLKDVSEDEILRVDVLQVFVYGEDAFDTVSTHCSWCSEEIKIGDTALLWGEPIGDSFVAIKTFEKDECLHAHLEAYGKAHGKSAMFIKHRG